jgi:hypothetical protein
MASQQVNRGRLDAILKDRSVKMPKQLSGNKPTTAKTEPNNTMGGKHPVKGEQKLTQIQKRANKPPSA